MLRRLLSSLIRRFRIGAPVRSSPITSLWVDEWNKAHAATRAQESEAVTVPVSGPEIVATPADAIVGVTVDDVALDCDRVKSRIVGVAPVSLHVIPEATVHGLDGAIVAPDRTLLSDLFPSEVGARDHPVFRRLRFARPRAVRGFSASLIQPLAGNYFHWLLECLPALGAVDRVGNVLDRLLIRVNPAPFQIETLERLGYERSELVELSAHDAVRCERLLQPTFMNAWAMPAWVPVWLRSVLVPPASSQASRRLYVSRNDTSARRVRNEDEIMDALTPLGFERVLLAGRSVSDQAALFDSAEIVIGPHGAGLANVVFCRPGTKFVEMFPERWTPLCYMRVARRAGLDYRYLTGGPVGLDDATRIDLRDWVPRDQSPHSRPFEIHPSKVNALVRALKAEGVG